MAIILIFLIKTFSTEGNIVTPSTDLELPVSTSVKQPKPQWSIEIARDMVMSEGTVIASTKTFAKRDSLMVPELYKWLEKKRRAAGRLLRRSCCCSATGRCPTPSSRK